MRRADKGNKMGDKVRNEEVEGEKKSVVTRSLDAPMRNMSIID
jgi:hypothetical protein